MKEIAEAEVGPIAEAVITIPANFMQEARDATLVAAKKAGINVQYIINEPTAAALYYGFKEGGSFRGKYVVYDLGGGTFDVSIVEANGNDIEVLATAGVAKLGGDDFDKALRELIKNKYSELFGEDINDEDLPLSDMASLKIKLTERQKSPSLIKGEIVEISRDEFEEAIVPLINQTELLCEDVLDQAGISVEDVRAVLLAGGSTRVPAIKKSISKVFRKEPVESENVDEVVALGASLYAAMKSSGEHLNAAQSASIDKLKVLEISTYYFGTLSINYNQARNTDEISNTIIINKGEKIPCSRTSDFSTMYDNQVKLNVL